MPHQRLPQVFGSMLHGSPPADVIYLRIVKPLGVGQGSVFLAEPILPGRNGSRAIV
jgi:hypothetical protein